MTIGRRLNLEDLRLDPRQAVRQREIICLICGGTFCQLTKTHSGSSRSNPERAWEGTRMTSGWRRVVAATGFGLYLVGLGFFGGVLVERVRFDQRRTTLIQQYTEAVNRWHAHLMRLERSAEAEREGERHRHPHESLADR